MRAFIFFSVHETLFDPVARDFQERYGVTSFSGFCWGVDQQRFLETSAIRYEPLFVFSRDILPRVPPLPDLAYLERCETKYGVPINIVISAERHLIKGRTQDQVLAIVETLFRHVEAELDRVRPDFVFSENVACMTSYIHYLVALDRGIPYLSFGWSRLSKPLIVSRDGLQDYAQVRARFIELQQRELTEDERKRALEVVEPFRAKPTLAAGQDVVGRRPGISRRELSTFLRLLRYPTDPGNPTTITLKQAIMERARRLVRLSVANFTGVFERNVTRDVKYVLYPLHVQPEASTLVQAPFYLDQVALIDDIARSLPVGYRLYVKEHGASRGRRPLGFYQRIKSILGVHLLDPDEPTFELIQNAAAVVVITGTMGWEGALLKKPVVTFGSVLFNDLPFVYKAKDLPKDQWPGLFRRAIFEHAHDEDQLLKFVVALLDYSSPGHVHNPKSFPHVLKPDNIRLITDAFAQTLGLVEVSCADDSPQGQSSA